jgi:nucleotide-binding universal stress UspA family protein
VSSRSIVIVPVDGSPETERIVEYAAGIASARAAELHAVLVVPREGGLWVAPPYETGLKARLRALRSSPELDGTAFRIVTLHGTPERAIAAYAQLEGASVIVVGGHYGTSRLWRSTAIASRLSRFSPVPVVVVPHRMENTGRFSPKRIVAAVDTTVASVLGLRAAVGLARRHDAHLTMFRAIDVPRHTVFSGSEAWRMMTRLHAEADVIGERLKRKALALGAGDVDAVVVTGDAHRGIVDAATAAAADLIVLGVSPRGWIDRAAFGSTLRAVLRRARMPVLVVPVIAGAHDWMDVNREAAFIGGSNVEPMTRRAA